MTIDKTDLKSKRIALGKSQAAVAAEIGVKKHVIQRYEAGLGVSLENGPKIAGYLGVDVTELPQHAEPQAA